MAHDIDTGNLLSRRANLFELIDGVDASNIVDFMLDSTGEAERQIYDNAVAALGDIDRAYRKMDSRLGAIKPDDIAELVAAFSAFWVLYAGVINNYEMRLAFLRLRGGPSDKATEERMVQLGDRMIGDLIDKLLHDTGEVGRSRRVVKAAIEATGVGQKAIDIGSKLGL